MEMHIMSEWVRVCRREDIPLQGARVVETDDARIAVFRTAQEEIYALEDRCPHKGGPLSQGIVMDKRVACPLHGWLIELDTGHACAPDDGCTRRYRIKVENDEVFLAFDD